MSLLVGNQLAKSYGANDVFENIDVRIEHEDRIGFVGSNGSGKTSLLRVLAGVEPSTAGQIFVAQNVRRGYLPQDPPPAGDQTLYEELHGIFAPLLAQGEELRQLEAQMTDPATSEAELNRILADYGHKQEAFERAGGYTIDQRVKSVLSGLGLQEALWHKPLAHLSGGQRTRALLGRLLLQEPDLLLLDEPTNHLDVRSVEWLESQLLAWKGALLVVSHDRYFLDTVVTRMWEMTHHRLETYRGNYSHFRQQRSERLERWRKEYEQQQEFIRETEDFVRRYKAGQRAKEAQGRETRLQRFLETEALPPPPSDQRIRLPLRTDIRSGDLVLRTRKLVVGYLASDGNGSGPTPILTVPDLDLRRGQIAALIGPNGAGKTTLIRTILGELEQLQGTFQLGAGVELGYLAQRHVGAGFGLMDSGQTVLNALLDIKNLPLERARTYLGQFLFHGDDVFKSIDSLSGGQRSRIALARLTLQGANFLLLDEPTNHLDLDSQEILQDALQQFSGTILLVTHDRALVDALATELWIVEPGEAGAPSRMEIFAGTWRQWMNERNGQIAATDSAAAKPVAPDQNQREQQREERRQRQTSTRRQADLADLEQQIHQMETRMAELEDQMAAVGQTQDYEWVQAISNEHQAVRRRVEQQMERWAEMAEAVV
ncbi:MAG: ABC-F family ATP-binding cassette domain-containing protein [Chloroflexi bacterium]|nr:ABC-F family ATP-binding cassette domain-containing protein [Chloroflexota bacterium]